jgi:hypothetical protein
MAGSLKPPHLPWESNPRHQRRHIVPERGSHVVGIPTASGGKVILPFLTEQQAADARAGFADIAAAAQEAAVQWAGKTKTCTNCGGAGGYNERRETKSASGGTVVTTVWVPCRPCKSSGQVPA